MLIPAMINIESLQSRESMLNNKVPIKLDNGTPVMATITNKGISVCFIISQIYIIIVIMII